MEIEATLQKLRDQGNFREIPHEAHAGAIDLSSNDYLGLAADTDVRQALYEYAASHDLPLSSSASRLLAAHQQEYTRLEHLLESLYPGRRVLTLNSGYHANTGLVSALADNSTLIIADKLVHASIIDGIVLSRAPFMRFPHNDYSRLEQLVLTKAKSYANVLIITESVFSMDGDRSDIRRLVELKKLHPGAMLYVDEAHAFGVEGPRGLGLVAEAGCIGDVDVIVGTFGKALASVGAFAAVSEPVRDYLVNRARSFIFSTALPPVNAAWSRLLIKHSLDMDSQREHLRHLAHRLCRMLGSQSPSHIQPYIVGDPRLTVDLSRKLMAEGVKVLPIRTPTVPAGTERLRFSLSAAITDAEMDKVANALISIGICSKNS